LNTMKTAVFPKILAAGAAMALGGCAVAPTAPTVMVYPGQQTSPAQFQTDSNACQQQAQALLAGNVQAANDQAVANVVVATAIGAAVGALMGQGYHHSNNSAAWGAGAGLLVGSAAAGGSTQASSYSLQQRFNIAYVQCMYQRGHQVPGQVRVKRQTPAVPPPNYPPPSYPPPNYAPPTYPPPNYAPPTYQPPVYPPPNYPAPN
jgi:hypothetical protein